MKSRACLVLLSGALLLGACEPASPPQPTILAVEPAQLVTSGESVELRLHIDALLPGTMDYSRRSVSGEDLASVMQVWLGERRVEVQRSRCPRTSRRGCTTCASSCRMAARRGGPRAWW
jgi:hypothetical protein